MSVEYDCIVVGGGPAGSTVAAIVAAAGHRTLVLERGRFPRFHIGESLMPETYWTFRRIGMLPKLQGSHFVKKYSVQFVTASGKESQPFYFDEHNPHECSQTWQVVRSEFDQMMLENAAERGAEVWQGANVTDVVLEDAVARGVLVSRDGEPPRRIDARVVVDATGTAALLSRRLGLRQADPMLRKASIFAHYRGALRDSGRDEGATLVLSTPDQDGWFWYIPLPDDIVSVGVVGDLDHLISGRASPERTLTEEIERCEAVRRRLVEAQRVSPVHVLSDFSYRSRACAGDGWVLVGDAFGFLDPIYSSGVFLALRSGEMAADCILEALGRNDCSAATLGRWGQELSRGMQAIRKLVYAFYTRGFSFGQFIRQHPQFKGHLVDLLIGNVFHEQVQEIFGPMGRQVPLPPSIPLETH